MTGIVIIDPIFAAILGAYLAITGVRIIMSSFAGLLDARDEQAYLSFIDSCNLVTIPGLILIHRLRIMRSGSFHIVDAHLILPEFWTIDRAHNDVEKFEKDLLQHFERKGEIHFHLDPCKRQFCTACDLADCPIRTAKFESRKPYTIEDLEYEYV